MKGRAMLLGAGMLAVGLALTGMWRVSAHGWPPVEVDLSLHRDGNVVTATVWLKNEGDDDTDAITLRAQVPKGAKYLDSWAGVPGSNAGRFDGNEVGWVNSGLEAEHKQGPFVYTFDVSNVTSNPSSPSILAWVKWVGEMPGTAVSRSVAVISTGTTPAASHTAAPVMAGDSARGSAVYGRSCQACHSAAGGGGIGPALRGSGFLREHGTLETFAPVVREGERIMPGFGPGQISDEEIADLFAYVRGLTP
ncbi:MAG: c-type cytochrome [Chloroflexi bacterium]|nr:c-type cytochrome [Chloroflexota bacterium]